MQRPTSKDGPGEDDPLEAALRGLVHDLRTPLAIVTGFAELLERRGVELAPEQQQEFASRILAAARELGAILDAVGRPPRT